MLKIKTIRGVAKRPEKTSGDGFKRKHVSLCHILTKESIKRKRHLRPKDLAFRGDLGLVIAYLPHV